MNKLLLVFLTLSFVSQVSVSETQTVTEEQAMDIAKRHVICKGLYSPSEIEGKARITFGENTNSWLITFPTIKTPDGASATGTDIRVFVSTEGKVTVVGGL